MLIKGIQVLSLIDYPGEIAATIFLFGCNFRCPYCHNKELVLAQDRGAGYSQEEVLNLLKERKKMLDAVCITGGEPTLNQDLPEFIRSIKALGYKIKLDTNGTNPKMLKELLEKGLIDHVAMDIKTVLSKEYYSRTTGTEIDLTPIKESIDIASKAHDYEFRITVVPGLITSKELITIAEYLKEKGANKAFYLQQFRPTNCFEPSFEKLAPYSHAEMLNFLEQIRPYFKKCELRE